jgi:hypothetical protein
VPEEIWRNVDLNEFFPSGVGGSAERSGDVQPEPISA